MGQAECDDSESMGPELYLDGSAFSSPTRTDFCYPWMIVPKKVKPTEEEERRAGGRSGVSMFGVAPISPPYLLAWPLTFSPSSLLLLVVPPVRALPRLACCPPLQVALPPALLRSMSAPPPPLASTASGRRCASIFDSWTLVEGRGQDEEEKNLEKDGKKKKKVRKVSDKEKAIRDAVTTHEVFHKLAVINIATEDGDKLWGGVEGRRGRAVQTRRGLRTSVRIARWVQILTVGQCVV